MPWCVLRYCTSNSKNKAKYEVITFHRELFLVSCLLCHHLAASDWFPYDEILYSFSVFREGDSTPAKEDIRFSTDPEELENRVERYGYNRLTEIGMRRAYVIGWTLQFFYDDLLGKSYNESNVYFRSIDSDRHKMSMLTTLAAVYPAARKWDTRSYWTPVPYTTVPKEDDFNTPLESCPVLQKAFKKRREGFYPEMLKHKDVMDAMTKVTGAGFNITEKPMYMIDIFYTLMAQVYLGIPIPVEIDENMWPDRIAMAANDAYNILYDSNKYDPYVAGVLFNEFFKDADKIAAGEDVSQRVKVYATEPDVAYAISKMSLHGPSFAVAVSQEFTLELRRENSTGKIFVVPRFNIANPMDSHGQGMIYSYLFTVMGCEEGEKRICYYDKFVELTRKNAWDYDTWKAKCHADVDE